MVFQSIPVYLDPPNWQQQPNQLLGGGGNEQQTLQQLPPLAPPTSQPAGGQPRPGSMAERARMAKIPQPEAALKCPRCESTNTKFCYYNNYSLSQPRHFCKTCRRYWTRGGALRNVPVGGGCRRNKKSKARSKSQATAATSSDSMAATSGLGSLPPLPPPTSGQLPFLPPLQNLSDYGDLEFQAGTSNGSSGDGQIMVPNGLLLGEQWRVQQFPFLTNLGTSQAGGLFSLDHSEEGTNNAQGLNLMSRNLLGLSGNYNHHPLWSANNSNGWTDASGLAPSSITTHHQ